MEPIDPMNQLDQAPDQGVAEDLARLKKLGLARPVPAEAEPIFTRASTR